MKHLEQFLNNLKKSNVQCNMNICDITSVHQRAEFVCNICNYTFITYLRKYVDGVKKCAKCVGKCKFTQEEVDLKVQAKNCTRIGLYVQARKPFEVKCNTCGYEWKISLDNLSRGKNCSQCAIKFRADLCRYSEDIVINKLMNFKFKLVNKYTNLYNPQNVQCLKCEHISEKIPHNIINELAFCQACTGGIRSNERLIKDLLRKQNDLKFIFNYQVKKLGSDKKYKIDFYFPEKSLVIEYNGLQHYEPVTFGSKIRDANKALKEQQIRDEYVRQLCKKSGLKIIEIDGRKFHGKKLEKLMLKMICDIKLGDFDVYCET